LIGIELSFDRYKLLVREKARIVEVSEGNPDDIKGFKGKEVHISFTCPDVLGKVYDSRFSQNTLKSEFGSEFEYRKAKLGSGKENLYFVAAVERSTFLSCLKFIKSLKIKGIKRLNFTPFVFLDLLSFLNIPQKYQDFLGIAFNGNFIYYLLFKGGVPQLASSHEKTNWEETTSEFIKTFFEEGISTVFLAGDFDSDAVNTLKLLTDDGDVHIFNPFIEFTMGTVRDFKQTSFYAALGVTL